VIIKKKVKYNLPTGGTNRAKVELEIGAPRATGECDLAKVKRAKVKRGGG
jgi:hypothetical protein